MKIFRSLMLEVDVKNCLVRKRESETKKLNTHVSDGQF